MEILVLSFAIGVVAGLRSFTAPAAVVWGARLGWLDLSGTRAAFLDSTAALWLATALALYEYYYDTRPNTPSRKTSAPFAARVVFGAFSGAVLAAGSGASGPAGAALGVLGAVLGTLAGYRARVALTAATHRPYLIAVLEDAVAVGGGFLIAAAVR